MKTHLRKLISTAVVGLALYSNGASAWAGATIHNDVTVNSQHTIARGSLTAARYSADSQQYIECYSQSFPDFVLNVCEAKDKSGRTFFCSNNDWRFTNAIKGITDSSYLEIGKGPGIADPCTDLTVNNHSLYLR